MSYWLGSSSTHVGKVRNAVAQLFMDCQLEAVLALKKVGVLESTFALTKLCSLVLLLRPVHF